MSFWVGGLGTKSDTVTGVHTGHADEETGNTWGHHSFYIVWQLMSGDVVPEPPIDPVDPPQPEPGLEWQPAEGVERAVDNDYVYYRFPVA